MALTQRLQFRQTQALVMTPQLMQAIKLLQLSHLDLAAYVETELERNPLLERANDDDDVPRVAPSRRGARPKAPKAARAATRPWPPPTGSARTWRPAVPRWKRGSAPNSKTFFRTAGP